MNSRTQHTVPLVNHAHLTFERATYTLLTLPMLLLGIRHDCPM